MTVQIQIRRDTTTNWQLTNPVLGAGEPGFDTTAKVFKIGDGLTPWTELKAFTHADVFAGVATSGSYNDLLDKPVIPAAQLQSNWTQTNTLALDYIRNKPTFAAVATSGSYADLTNKPALLTVDSLAPVAVSGSYADLTNKPTFATIATSGLYADLVNKPNFATVATSGSYADLTNKPTLATVAITGSYNSLTNTPTLASVATTGSYTDLVNKPTFATVATSGSYADLTNKPTFTTSLVGLTDVTITNVSAGQILKYNGTRWINDSDLSGLGVIGWNDVQNKPTFATVATSGLYADLINKPTLFSGSYTDLTNKPSFAVAALTGSYTDLLNRPTLSTVASTGSYTDLTNRPAFATVATSGAYADLTGKPTLFSGAYADLTGKPTIVAQVNADWNSTSGLSQILNKPTLFSGAYADLTGKPTLATVATSGSYNDLTNKPTFTTSLTGLTDVAISNLTSGQVLKYDGTKWVNGGETGGTATVTWNDVLNKPTFADVATTGSYNNLTDTPTLSTVAASGSYTDLINTPSLPTFNISAPVIGQVLTYNGSSWKNSTGVTVNLTDFGVIGNSTSGDDVTFQAAIDYISKLSDDTGVQGTIQFRGTVYITTPKKLGKNIRLVGAGRGFASVIKPLSNFTGSYFITSNGDDCIGGYAFRIRHQGYTIDCSLVTTQKTAMYFYKAYDVMVDDVWVYNVTGTGIQVEGTSASPSNHITLNNVSVYGLGNGPTQAAYGIRIGSYSNGIMLTKPDVENCNKGISIEGTSVRLTMVAPYLERNITGWISSNDATGNVVVLGGTCIAPGASGVAANISGYNNTVTGGRYTANTGVGLYVEQTINRNTKLFGVNGDISDTNNYGAIQAQANWTQTSTTAVDFIKNKPTLFSGAYADLTGKPTIPTALTGLSDISLSNLTSGQVLKYDGTKWVNGTDLGAGSTGTVTWNDVLNKPTFATVATSGLYTDLTGRPTLATVATTGAYADLTGKPTLFSGAYADLTGKPTLATVATSGAYTDLTGRPTLAAVATTGAYSDLIGKPTIPAAQVNSDWTATTGLAQILNKPTLFSGSYTDLTNKPIIPTALTGLSDIAIVNLTAGQVLKYDGTKWINGTDLGTGSAGTVYWNDILNKPTFATVATSGSYLNLTDKPTFATVATSGAYTDLTGRPTLATVATTGAYADLTGKPTLFSGSYTDLTNKPTLFSGSYTDLTNKPSLATVATSGSYTDLTNKPTLATVATTGSYTDLTNKPTIFSGAYADLTGKPTLATVATSGAYADLTGKPTLFSGAYADLTGKPTLATVATSGSYADLSGKPTLATVATSGSYNDLADKPTFTTSLTGLTDVEITSAVTGQILKFNGTKWINDADLTGGISGTVAWTDVQNKPSFATVATSGSYTDLTSKPILATSITARNGTVYQASGIGSLTVGYADVLNTPTLSTSITIRNQTAIQVSGTKNGSTVSSFITPRVGSITNTPVTAVTARTGIIQIPDGVSFSATNDFNKLVNTPYTSVFRYLTTAEIADVQSGTQLIDLTAKLQYALTNNIDVYFPAGTYAIAGTLTISNANTTITADKAVLVRKPGVTAAAKLLVVNASNVTVKGMTFDYNSKIGNSDSTPLVRVQLPYATFDGCTFITVATVDNTYQNTLRTAAGATNCTIKNSKFVGGEVQCNNTDGFVFDNNTMVGGISINALSSTTTHSNDCRITNNYIEVMPGSVVGANPAAIAVVSRNASQPPRNLLISNNTFVAKANLLFFMTIDTTNGSVINNNTFRTIGAITIPYGVELVNSDNVVFDGNILDFTSLTTPATAVILNSTRTSAVTNNSISFGPTVPNVNGNISTGVLLLAPNAGNKSDNNLVNDNIINMPSEGAGISLITNAANTSVSRNMIRDNQVKLYTRPWATDSSNNIASYPTLATQATSSYSQGIKIDCIGTNAAVDANVLSGNTVQSFKYGFRIYNSTNTVITDNTVDNVATAVENVNLTNVNVFVKYNSWQGDITDTTTIFTSGFTASQSVTGLFVYTGTADATITLYTLDTDANGKQYKFYNSSNYNVTLVSGSSSQFFREASTSTSGITGYIIPAGAYLDIIAVYSSSTAFWLVKENEGASSIVPMGETAAARLLTQATFGPTIDTIASTAAMSYDQWFNYQKAIPRTKTFTERVLVGNVEYSYPWRHNWWTDIVTDEDQLLQRMAFALSEIVVVGGEDGIASSKTAYLDVLYKNALGNFRTLLQDVTLNPAMGGFLNTRNNYSYNLLMFKSNASTTVGSTTLTMPDLSHNGPGYNLSGTLIGPGKRVVGVNLAPNTTIVSIDSTTNTITLSNAAIATGTMWVFICDPSAKQRPDENYAREVMQLFSIGLWMLNNDGTYKLKNGAKYATYDQDVVTETAKIFTGWNVDSTYLTRTDTPITVTSIDQSGVGGTTVFRTSVPHNLTLNSPIIFGNGSTLPVPSSELTSRSFTSSLPVQDKFADGIVNCGTNSLLITYKQNETVDLVAGMEIYVYGTLAAGSGQGAISGYTNPTAYKVATSSLNVNKTLMTVTLTTLGGTPVTTTAGTTTGLSFVPSNTYYITKKNFTSTSFSISRAPLVYGSIVPVGSDTPLFVSSTTTSFTAARYRLPYEVYSRQLAIPMIPHSPGGADERYHDPREKKTIGVGGVGTTTYIPENGQNIGMSLSDINKFLDILFAHPNVGPFISRQLIQRLVTSNPSAEYTDRVATVFNNNGKGVRGDLFAVAKAILTDVEATTPTNLDQDKLNSSYGKLREPILRATQMWRAFNARTKNNDLKDATLVNNAQSTDYLSQNILSAQTVFNFFTPDYTRAGTISSAGIAAPEFQITGEYQQTKMENVLWSLLYRWRHSTYAADSNFYPGYYTGVYSYYNNQTARVNNSEFIAADDPIWTYYYVYNNLDQWIPYASNAADVSPLIDKMNQVFMGGTMPSYMRTMLINYVVKFRDPAVGTSHWSTAMYNVVQNDKYGTNGGTYGWVYVRIIEAASAILFSSQYAIQR